MQVDEYTAPDFASAALITIDTQRDVLDGGPLEIAGTSAVLPQTRVLVDAFRAGGHPIVHVVRLYQPDGSNVDPCRRRAVQDGARVLMTGGAGSQLAEDLMLEPDVTLDSSLLLAGGVQPLGEREVAMYKPRWGAFFGTRSSGTCMSTAFPRWCSRDATSRTVRARQSMSKRARLSRRARA